MTPAAVVFDLFGTILDIGSLRDVAARISPDPDAFVEAWREKQVAYMFAAASMGCYEDFDRITRYALHYVAAKAGARIVRDDLDALIGAWRTVPAYDDALAALIELRAIGVKTAVLTNGTAAGARTTLKNANALDMLDAVLSVETIETFKPDPAVYRIATRYFESPAERLVFVSSNGWDATGAREFGLNVVWCNRAGLPAETFGRPPNATITSLVELAETISGLSD